MYAVAQDLPEPFDPTRDCTGLSLLDCGYFDTNGDNNFDFGVDVPLSLQFDEFYSYPVDLLDKYFPADGWDSAAGTGLLDVIITTRSNGQTNTDIAGDIYNLAEPITNTNTNPIHDDWGVEDTDGNVDIMLVNDLYDYLNDTFSASIPVFTFDQNETGGNADLFVTAIVEILSADQSTVIADWTLDNTADGILDGADPVLAAGEVCVPDGISLIPNADFCFDNNVGSGAFDYIVFAPTMDLSIYDNTDYIFKVSWWFEGVDDGGEEITLSGRFSPGSVCPDPENPACQTIPEPNSLALMAIALMMLGFSMKRRYS